jgi:hypothetical protein
LLGWIRAIAWRFCLVIFVLAIYYACRPRRNRLKRIAFEEQSMVLPESKTIEMFVEKPNDASTLEEPKKEDESFIKEEPIHTERTGLKENDI